MRRVRFALLSAKALKNCVRRNRLNKLRAPPNSLRKLNAKQRKPRLASWPKRASAKQRWRSSKKLPGMLDTKHAKLQKRYGGEASDGLNRRTKFGRLVSYANSTRSRAPTSADWRP